MIGELKFMPKRGPILALTALLAWSGAAGAAEAVRAPAPPPAIAPGDAAFDDIYLAVNESIDREAVLNRMLVSLANQLATSDPESAALEKRFPGILKAMVEGARPAMTALSQRVEGLFRQRLIAMLKANLTVPEAREIAAFYRSPLGRKIMRSAVSGMDGAQTMKRALREEEVTAADIRADTSAAVASAIARITPAEMAQLNRLIATRPALRKMNVVRAQMNALNVQIANEPPTAAEEEAALAQMRAAAAKHIAALPE